MLDFYGIIRYNFHCSVLLLQSEPDAGKWPVGQVVKTVASHAINIGSNPVRVTKAFSAPLK